MAVTVTPTPASGSITAKRTVVRFDLAGLSLNDEAAYNALVYPTEPEVRYYVTYELAAAELGRSHVFACDHDGEYTLDNYIFPEAGSWNVVVRLVSDDSAVKTQAVTVA